VFADLKIIIIDDDQSRAHDLSVIFKFMGVESELVRSDNWQAKTFNPDKTLAFCVGQHDHYQQLSDLLSDIKQLAVQIPILLIADISFTGDVDDELAIQVIGRIDSPPKYNALLELLHGCQECRVNTNMFTKGTKPLELFRSLIGSSEPVQEVRNLIEQVAPTDANVLVLGESGTGKEVAARNIHYLSKRSESPFIPVNCGAIPAELLESELFGHEKGAFTGALSARQGRFELAQGGTLFLDEIGDMPLNMQVKILRVLQEKCFERVGGNKTIQADVRIIAATHRNLEREVEKGEFREDLFYRLNVFPIEMPALRERGDDVPLLINELTARLEKHGRDSVRFTPNALASLIRHDWPGNVRELANLVERLCILYPYGVVDANELPKKYQYLDGLQPYQPPKLKALNLSNQSEVSSAGAEQSSGEVSQVELPGDGVNLKEVMAKMEIDYINKALDEQQGVVAKAAEMLGMRRTTLVEKMKKYQIVRKD
jgi:sigma-54 specific flagellar transcriptional regulator A